MPKVGVESVEIIWQVLCVADGAGGVSVVCDMLYFLLAVLMTFLSLYCAALYLISFPDLSAWDGACGVWRT